MKRKVKVRINIKRLISERNISLRELSRLTDIRHPTLSELANNKRQNINFQHIERIAESLSITDIREIIDLDISEN
ncbi:helix-turn-helix transcriptional regulator [Bacillus sp. ISL-35]|uniref:helix-turn-helix domain-containing protein n=1 Tax=Bacillus sp. ISL-35 TaxID=2819122 RepID=UPI001BE91FA6|nr:helix-turn-helix transcriptional regulator [Bacillus sp. ISL-35]MBT2679270.1 helix-turn-helix transcriptional regulator [Bacillus sp. ISL-35]MBT2703166.1 helix-turn-helix transcriptional regulator [Chryseobacterium sp. ISL-80]